MQHPNITLAEKTGYHREIDETPVCPVCNEMTDDYIFNKYDVVVGCETCTRFGCAWDYRRNRK